MWHEHIGPLKWVLHVFVRFNNRAVKEMERRHPVVPVNKKGSLRDNGLAFLLGEYIFLIVTKLQGWFS